MDQSLFNKGETPAEFIESMGDNRAKFEEHIDAMDLNASQTSNLPNNLKMAVIAEVWSGDVLYYMPVLLKIAQQADWDVRVFRREKFPKFRDQYLKDGLYRSIPVAVIYDQDFNVIAHWIERPEIATQIIEEESLKLRRRLREEYKDKWQHATVEEVHNIFKAA